MMARSAAVFAAVVALAAAAAADQKESKWGTETVFLLKGGYGISANLLSGTPRTTRERKAPKAVPAPTAEEAAGEEMLKATRTASQLTQQLQAAVHQAVVQEDEKRQEEKENHDLKAQVARDQGLLKQANVDKASLRKQVIRLTADVQATKIRAERAEGQAKQATVAEAKLQAQVKHLQQDVQAYAAKDKMVENEMIISNKAWSEAAEEAAGHAVPAKAASAQGNVDNTHLTSARVGSTHLTSIPLKKTPVVAAKALRPAAPAVLAKKAPGIVNKAAAYQAAEAEVEDEDVDENAPEPEPASQDDATDSADSGDDVDSGAASEDDGAGDADADQSDADADQDN